MCYVFLSEKVCEFGDVCVFGDEVVFDCVGVCMVE